jgi:biotin operon repressor
MTRDDLAKALGFSQRAIAAALSELQKEGRVMAKRGKVPQEPWLYEYVSTASG